MYSIVSKIAIDVIRAVLLANTIPTLGLSIDYAEVAAVEPNPNKTSVNISKIFFLFNPLYFLLQISL